MFFAFPGVFVSYTRYSEDIFVAFAIKANPTIQLIELNTLIQI